MGVRLTDNRLCKHHASKAGPTVIGDAAVLWKNVGE